MTGNENLVRSAATLTAPRNPEALATSSEYSCQSCGARGMAVFYEIKNIPVHSCLLLEDEEKARGFPRRDLELGFCRACGFIQNVIFDPGMLRYSSAYEEQQSFSPRFNQFAEELAGELIERYQLRGKQIVEIGCGKGDFLVLISSLGGNRGIGIDPSYIPERVEAPGVRFIVDFYSERYADLAGDLICCRHTLEHIPETRKFLTTLRASLGENNSAVIFFEVPDVGRVLREIAFWDIYYEHCSYFTLGSLARLFRATGFEVLRLAKAYDDQYLLLDAVAAKATTPPALREENDLEQLTREVEFFAGNYRARLREWQMRIAQIRNKGQRAALWGSGSKCVSFLSTMDVSDEIQMIVDINPFRHGKYLAGSGKRISPPQALKDYQPDVVIAMNSIYAEEIRQTLESMGLRPELMAL
ncbi:MAG: methyltransferase domain-containing protein [Acidobacteria bacterium]|nr:methyltransferase domain-containing protein [Acidobacteriota bacterium]